MRKPEQRQWDVLRTAMNGYWDVQRHEDRYCKGIPDLSYALREHDGWIELKTIPAWPKGHYTPVKINHLTSDQVNWLEARGRNGSGKVFLLLAVGKDMTNADWLLLHWPVVRDLYNGDSWKQRIMDYAHMYNVGTTHLRERLLDYL